MTSFSLFASPWWVNLLIFIPFAAYYFWRHNKLEVTHGQLLFSAVFAIAFGFVEAAVVVYLRAATGLLPGYAGTLADVARLSSDIYSQAKMLGELPKSLFVVEFLREIATMIMLVSVAFFIMRDSFCSCTPAVERCQFYDRRTSNVFDIGTKKERYKQLAIFLWTFAVWDIFYYVWLWILIRWPSSLTTLDVLFLVPVPWLAQVWFPILVSIFTIFAVVFSKKSDV